MQTRFDLTQADIPESRCSLLADFPKPLPPPLHPGTKQPVSPEALLAIFPENLMRQEMSPERRVEVPEPVRDIYATWYPDQAKRWALSVLNRYEVNQQREDTHITPGQVYTVEGGLSYGILKTVPIGPIGYYQQQVTADSGSPDSARNRVAGIGPEISAFFPSLTFGVSLRYAYEFMAEDRLQGHTFTLTSTRKL